MVDQTVEKIGMVEKVAEEWRLGWFEAIGTGQRTAAVGLAVVGQLGQGKVGRVELEAVGRAVGRMLGRRQAAAKTAEAFQLGWATVERLPAPGIVVVPGSGIVVVLGSGTVVVVAEIQLTEV